MSRLLAPQLSLPSLSGGPGPGSGPGPSHGAPGQADSSINNNSSSSNHFHRSSNNFHSDNNSNNLVQSSASLPARPSISPSSYLSPHPHAPAGARQPPLVSSASFSSSLPPRHDGQHHFSQQQQQQHDNQRDHLQPGLQGPLRGRGQGWFGPPPAPSSNEDDDEEHEDDEEDDGGDPYAGRFHDQGHDEATYPSAPPPLPELGPPPPYVGSGPSSHSGAWPPSNSGPSANLDFLSEKDRLPGRDRRLQRAETTDFRHMLPTWSGGSRGAIGRGASSRITSLWSEFPPPTTPTGTNFEEADELARGATLRGSSSLLQHYAGDDGDRPLSEAEENAGLTANSTLPAEPPAASTESVTAGDATVGVAGLNDVLTAYGPPSEWWHDSIILGRLSALAQRYFAARACRRPWEAWRGCVLEAQEKRARQNAARRMLAIRKWRFRTLFSGKGSILANGKRIRLNKDKLQLLFALRLAFAAACRPALERLRIVAFFKRDLERQMRLLHLVEARVMGTLAKTHYYKNLMRAGLAAFWIVWQLASSLPQEERSKSTGAPKPLEGSAEEASPAASHILQVVRRAWRRWRWSTQMWLSPAEYDARLTEAWLIGDSGTPRSYRGQGEQSAVTDVFPKEERGFLSGSNFAVSPDGSGVILLQNETGQPVDTSVALSRPGKYREQAQEELPFPGLPSSQVPRPARAWNNAWGGLHIDENEDEASPSRFTVPLRRDAARGFPAHPPQAPNTQGLAKMEALRGRLLGRRGLTPRTPVSRVPQGVPDTEAEAGAGEEHHASPVPANRKKQGIHPLDGLQDQDSDQEYEFVACDVQPVAVGGQPPTLSATSTAGLEHTSELGQAASTAGAAAAEESAGLAIGAGHPQHHQHHRASGLRPPGPGPGPGPGLAPGLQDKLSPVFQPGAGPPPAAARGAAPSSVGGPARGPSISISALDGGTGSPMAGVGDPQNYWAARSRIAPSIPRREVKLRGAG